MLPNDGSIPSRSFAIVSIQARLDLVQRSFFQDRTQSADLVAPNLTQTSLIALLLDITNGGVILEFTAVRSDHSDDSALGEHCHANGWCADVWPLASYKQDDYLDANDPRFARFLSIASRSPFLYQIGLAGSADTSVNRRAAGATVFSDDGADHVHLGAQ